LIVAGIIVAAVGDRLSLVHPEMTTDMPSALILLGGVALYLMGNAVFKKTVNGTNFPLSHLAGLLLLIPLLLFFRAFSVLALSATTTALLTLIALWESLSLRSVRRELAES
jgi:low temperature requirement protein LtrA